MPYNNAVKEEARFLASLGPATTEDKFHGLYSGILTAWFPTDMGFIIEHQVLGPGGKPEYIVVRHGGGKRNPLLIVELKRLDKWTNAGRNEVLGDLTQYIEGRFDQANNQTIYGLGGIGLQWMVCKMEKSGPPTPRIVLNWCNDISSDQSFNAFKDVATEMYKLV